MSKTNRVGFKEINKLAIPSIIAGIAEPLLSIVDTAVVGNVSFDSIEALAAVGIAGSFISAIVWVIGQTRAAISSIVAQYVGKNQLEKIISLPAQMIGINIALSCVLFLLTSFFATQIFELYNATGSVLEYSVSYYRIRAWGLPFSLFVFTVMGVFTGLQNTFIPMLISITGALINAGLDVLLVYGVDGVVTPMHVEGAAYASVISQFIMAFMALLFYLKKTPFKLFSFVKFHFEIKRLLSVSVNLFVRALALNLALYLANSYATDYGKEYIAAQTICFQVWLFFAFFVDGYASVGSIVSGKLKGEGSQERLQFLVKDLCKYGVFVAFILMGTCFVFYNQIGKIFTSETGVLVVFYSVFWLVIATQPINALAFVYDGIFKGLAEAVVLRNTVAIATCLGFIPTLLIADYFDLKLIGIWMAFSVWMLFRSGILYVYFQKNVALLLKR
jgi:MATE family multidrug resistance protein